MPEQNIFRGVLVAADTRQEAEDQYRNVVQGKGYIPYKDSSSTFTFLSNVTGIQPLNPLTGKMDLEKSDGDFSGGMKFLSESSNINMSAFYTKCSGCNSHIIGDDPDLSEYCHVCATALPEDNSVDSFEGDFEVDSKGSDSIIQPENAVYASGDTTDKAIEEYRSVAAAIENESDDKLLSICSDSKIMSNIKLDYSPFDATPAKQTFRSLSSGERNLLNYENANLYQCSNDECAKYVVSSTEQTIFCAECSAGLVDPEQDGDYDANHNVEIEDNDGEPMLDVSKVVVTASNYKAAKARFEKIVSDRNKAHCYRGIGYKIFTNLSSDNLDCDPFNGDTPKYEKPAFASYGFDAVASAGTEVEGFYKVCASDACEKHTISTDEEIIFCPSCSSGLIEPEDDDVPEEDLELSEGFRELSKSMSNDYDDDDYDDDDYDDADDDDDDYTTEDMEDDLDASIEPENDGMVEVLESPDSEYDDYDISEEALDAVDDGEGEADTILDDLDEDEDEDSDYTLAVSSVRLKGRKNRRLRNKETVEADLLSVSSNFGELKPSKFEVVCAGKVDGETTWYAIYDGMPVAKATNTTAVRHQDIFEKPLYQKAVVTAAQTDIEQALNDFGFERFNPKFKTSAYVLSQVDKEVNKKVKAIENHYMSESADYNERMLAAMGTAAEGINNNFFRGMSNPIITALATNLQAAGLQNAEAMVKRLFNEHSHSYHKAIITKASDICKNDITVQNQLSEAIASARVSVPSNTLKMGTPVNSDRLTKQTATASNSTQNSFESKLNLALSSFRK